MLSRSNSVSSRRSLQMQQQLEGEKQYKVNLPDNQVHLLFLEYSSILFPLAFTIQLDDHLYKLYHYLNNSQLCFSDYFLKMKKSYYNKTNCDRIFEIILII